MYFVRFLCFVCCLLFVLICFVVFWLLFDSVVIALFSLWLACICCGYLLTYFWWVFTFDWF